MSLLKVILVQVFRAVNLLDALVSKPLSSIKNDREPPKPTTPFQLRHRTDAVAMPYLPQPILRPKSTTWGTLLSPERSPTNSMTALERPQMRKILFPYPPFPWGS